MCTGQIQNYVHFSSACKGMLSEFQKGGDRTLLDVIEGIALTSHAGNARLMEKATVFARYPMSASGGFLHLKTKLNVIYPNYEDMIEFARKLTRPGEYEDDILLLLDPDSVLTYANE